jgi:hypothetical protein
MKTWLKQLKRIPAISENFKEIPKKKIDHAYGEGKWTIRELVQHVIDAERVSLTGLPVLQERFHSSQF